MKYGFDRKTYYVVKVTHKVVGVSSPKWLSDSIVWLKHDEFYLQHEAVYIGKGRRSLLSFLPFIGNFFPKYTRP